MIDRPSSPLELRASSAIDWPGVAPAGVTLGRVYIDVEGSGLQVAIAYAGSAPSRSTLRSLWDLRAGRQATDVAVAVAHQGRVTVFGPDEESQPIELPRSHAARVLQSALDEPDSGAVWDRFGDLRRSVATSGTSGVLNAGLFARHFLEIRVPQRPDWADAGVEATRLLDLRGKRLIAALGFSVEEQGGALLLSGPGATARAVAVLLDESESFDSPSPKHQLSPVAFGLREAQDHKVEWLIVLRDERVRLYPGRTGVGVGQKGQTETFFEIDLSSIGDEQAALLPLVFSASALEPQGSTQQILDGSGRYATDLGTRLRDRIYEDVVPPLAQAVAQRLPEMGLQVDEDGLRTAYRVTLRILFRLLFQAYAEDRGLLPAGRNARYDANSLKTAAQRDRDTDPAEFGEAATLWLDLEQVWEAIDKGNAQWLVPAYNGGLFNRASDEGALIAKLRLPDSVMGPVLQALLVDVDADRVRGPVDFRSLSVREFGTIYEGLLESSLSLAETDLTFDKDDYPVPAGPGDEVKIWAGSAYFHSASGERKATGSYFTPAIVVDHLIERSIVPVLEKHLERITHLLDAGDEVAAGRDFFDFRVADLAMGSGHFLVAAIDRVEAMYRDFLTRRDVPRVREELLRIHQTAVTALGRDSAAVDQVDDVGLLRRQVARRCIYGIDVNPLALELSRLALWIHTFVPGLPMSSFDHNLVCANSLTGIGTEEEAIAALEPNRPPGQVSFLDDVITEALAQAKVLLLDAANADEADKAGVEQGARLRAEARDRLQPIRRIFDLAVAIRTGDVKPIMALDAEALDEAAAAPEVRSSTKRLNPAHMPYLFPEVFLRDRPGFDVLLGNPPWEEVMIEEPKFWLRIRPGLMGLRPADLQIEIARLRAARPDLTARLHQELSTASMTRRVLLEGPYPGLGTGDVDLYKAFAWRYWQLLREMGRTAFVAPRSLLNSAGTAQWRNAIFPSAATEIATLINNGRWVFQGVHPQYVIALCVAQRGGASIGRVTIAGPFHSLRDFRNVSGGAGVLNFSTVAGASTEAAIPSLPDARSAAIYTQFRESARLDSESEYWAFRPLREFDATNDRRTFDAGARRAGLLPVIGGRGFNLWQPATGEVYAWADPTTVQSALSSKRRRQAHLRSSAFYGSPAEEVTESSTLPLHRARIALRDVTNSTNSRTVVTALIPPGVVLVNQAPYLLRRAGGTRVEAFLLAVLSSLVLDWYARRYVEIHLNFHILNALPVPRPVGDERSGRVIQIAGRLAAVDERYREWADEVGVPVGSVQDPAEKQDLIDELDALVSLLYGLTADQVEHIFATFHRGWDYGPRLAAVLHHFHVWERRK